MSKFGTESPYSRVNLDGEDGTAECKEELVVQHKVGHFMVGEKAIASRLYHSHMSATGPPN